MPGLRHRYAHVCRVLGGSARYAQDVLLSERFGRPLMGGMFRARVSLSEQFGLPLACYLCNSLASRGSPDGHG